jgi:hypothetical protein
MSLFTGMYSSPLHGQPDPLMQSALEAAQLAQVVIGAPNANRIAIMVVALTSPDENGQHRWAGLRQQEEHYSASLIKVAAMYAAFDLRASAEQLREERSLTSWPDVETAIVAEWTPELLSRIPERIRNAPELPVPDRTRSPRYANMLTTAPDADGNVTVQFTPRIDQALDDMVPQAHNTGATTIIRDLGYPYLNAKLADDGFFDGAGSGIWLAGDYSGASPYVRIDSINDGLVAQATTAWHMALLYTLLADRRLVGPISSTDMLGLLGRAGNWFGHAVPPVWSGGPLRVTGSKVGVGPLKTGESVFSEAIFVHDTQRDLHFAVVWQNAIGSFDVSGRPAGSFLETVARLIEAAVFAFVP